MSWPEPKDREPIEMRLKPAALARHGLPDIAYPLTIDLLDAALGDSGELPFADMLHLLQQRSADANADWQALGPALDRLAELVAPDEDRALVSAAGEEWWLEIGPVNLALPIVTVQRGEELIAALAKRDDGRLRLAAYRPLDARSARLLIGLGRRPQPEDGRVCMRENNWEYALDCSAGMGQFYAFERGDAHLSSWSLGIGLAEDGSVDGHWQAMQTLAARRPTKVAVELGVAYAYSAPE